MKTNLKEVGLATRKKDANNKNYFKNILISSFCNSTFKKCIMLPTINSSNRNFLQLHSF